MTLHAFGDSIAFGYSATSFNGYAQRVAAALGVPLNNHGVSGIQMPDTAATVYGVPVQPDTQSLWIPGYNDYRWWGADPAGFDTFENGLKVLLAWLAIPEARKVRGQAGTPSGIWNATPVYGGNLGRYSSSQGSVLSFQVRGTAIYLGSIALQNMNGGLLGVRIDGEPVGTWPCMGAPVCASGLGYTPFLVHVPDLDDDLHTVEAVVESPSGNVYVDWCAGNAGSRYTAGPKVYVGGTLRMANGTYAAAAQTQFDHGTADLARLYSHAVWQAVQDFQADGLRVSYVDTNGFYDPDHGDNTQPDVHPNDQGHQHLADAFLGVMS